MHAYKIQRLNVTYDMACCGRIVTMGLPLYEEDSNGP